MPSRGHLAHPVLSVGDLVRALGSSEEKDGLRLASWIAWWLWCPLADSGAAKKAALASHLAKAPGGQAWSDREEPSSDDGHAEEGALTHFALAAALLRRKAQT